MKNKITQAEIKRSVNVGPTMAQVSPVMYWYKNGHFASKEEALGAFKLAYQQGMDGMGKSVQEWMGLNDAQFDAWMRNNQLPDQ